MVKAYAVNLNALLPTISELHIKMQMIYYI